MKEYKRLMKITTFTTSNATMGIEYKTGFLSACRNDVYSDRT